MVWLFSSLQAKRQSRALACGKRPEVERFGGLVLAAQATRGRAKSRADARDTGAALLIRGGGALGVETPAHEGRKCYSNAKVIKKRDK